ncbi:MAG TPA: PHB depolymerase family esterase [Polyangiaceae bacterium]|nr:PHB depolymerase family esterase [Polyangiaceae bacterium]
MSNRLRFAGPALASLAAALLVPVAARAQACDAGWQCSVSYGANTAMDLYVPKMPAPTPPIVVVLHYCGGNAAAVHAWLQSYADQYGFALIAPTAGGNCFDATPARSGERANIAAMVSYVVTHKTADATRVYVVGASSGACMTQALLAAYPDVFAAGSSLAGVPAGAWTGGNSYAWSTSGNGMPTTAQGWGDIVRNADKGFTGTRPRVQIWHGMGDTTLTYSQTYPFEVEQWTNVFGVTSADATMTSVKPPGAMDTWARTSYADTSGTVVVEANSGPSNVDHDLAGRGLWGDVVRFFGLDQSTVASGGMGGASAGLGGLGGAGAGGQSAGASGATSSGGGGVGGARGGGAGTATSRGGATTGGRASGAGRSNGGANALGGATNPGGTSSDGAGTVVSGAGGANGGAKASAGGTSSPSAGKAAGGAAGVAAATGGATSSSDASCGCRAAGSDGAPLGALAALIAGALGLIARRRERTRN